MLAFTSSQNKKPTGATTPAGDRDPLTYGSNLSRGPRPRDGRASPEAGLRTSCERSEHVFAEMIPPVSTLSRPRRRAASLERGLLVHALGVRRAIRSEEGARASCG